MTRNCFRAAVLALALAAARAAASPTASVGVAASTKSGLALQVTPESGALPLHVTFTLKAPKAVSWRLDFGDGRSETAKGAPPATVTHVYRTKGSFIARLSTVVSRRSRPYAPAPVEARAEAGAAGVRRRRAR